MVFSSMYVCTNISLNFNTVIFNDKIILFHCSKVAREILIKMKIPFADVSTVYPWYKTVQLIVCFTCPLNYYRWP